jgi:hypothetical protein
LSQLEMETKTMQKQDVRGREAASILRLRDTSDREGVPVRAHPCGSGKQDCR